MAAGVAITMVAAHNRQPCGCVAWLEWDDGQDAWVVKSHRCCKHGSQ